MVIPEFNSTSTNRDRSLSTFFDEVFLLHVYKDIVKLAINSITSFDLVGVERIIMCKVSSLLSANIHSQIHCQNEAYSNCKCYSTCLLCLVHRGQLTV